MARKFARPAPPTEGLDLDALSGSLLVITAQRVEKDVATKLGPRDATIATVEVLDGDHAGETFDEAYIWPKLLQANIRGLIGDPVLGRLAKGIAKPGQSAPWILTDPTDDDEALAASVDSDNSPF